MLENIPTSQDEEIKNKDFSQKTDLLPLTTESDNDSPKKNNFLGLIILSIICVLGLVVGFLSTKDSEVSTSSFSKGFSISKNFTRGKYIATISIEGTIEEENQTYNQKWLLSTIDELKWDSNNVGIMLKINSPGGAVYEADEVYLALLDYKTFNKPVFAYFESLAASGGYYIGCAADKIYANRNTLTGSIGVIYGQHVDLSKLLEKYGIKYTTITAGENKSMGSIAEPLTQQQKDILQSIADECYEQFTGIVAESRNLDINTVKKLADGRVYTAKQALENKLIDEISTYNDAYSSFLVYIYENYDINKSIDEVYFEPEYKFSISDYLNSVFSNISNNMAKTSFSSIGEEDNCPVFFYQLF